jgi:hypothetical protein
MPNRASPPILKEEHMGTSTVPLLHGGNYRGTSGKVKRLATTLLQSHFNIDGVHSKAKSSRCSEAQTTYR